MPAIFDITAERALPGIEIDRADLVALGQQRHDQMHGDSRLAGAALLVADDDDMRPAAHAVPLSPVPAPTPKRPVAPRRRCRGTRRRRRAYPARRWSTH